MSLNYQTSYTRERRAERSAKGLCYECDSPPSIRTTGTLKGTRFKYCDECRRYHRQKQRDYHQSMTKPNPNHRGRPPVLDADYVERLRKITATAA